jgi:opacity protein-like surface antigen
LLLAAFALAASSLAWLPGQAAEIIPAVGLTRPVDGDETRASGSLALRGEIFPMVRSELGVAYRSEERHGGQLDLRQWPITASVYLSPVRALYAGGGVGWYHTTYDYDQDVVGEAIEDETKQHFGVHLGGGLQVPLSPAVGVDLNGRYVMMRDQEDKLVPDEFNPDFWTLQAGLAFRF